MYVSGVLAFLATVGLPAEIGDQEFYPCKFLRQRSHRLELVPQTRYKCPNTQERRRECAPIEFGGVRLTDAANEAYPGLQGANDKVLDYKGVGSATTRRLTVRRASEALKTHLSTLPSLCADTAFQGLVLVRLVRVAKASWQPVLCYEAPIPASPSPQDVQQDLFA